MATKIKTVSILFGVDCVDRASVTFSEVEKVNGEWHEQDGKPITCSCRDNTLSFKHEGKEYTVTFDLAVVLATAKKLAISQCKWSESNGDTHFWYSYVSEDDRFEVPCSVKEGIWSLKVGLKTSNDPTLPGKKSAVVTGLLNYRRCKPMTVEF